MYACMPAGVARLMMSDARHRGVRADRQILPIWPARKRAIDAHQVYELVDLRGTKL